MIKLIILLVGLSLVLTGNTLIISLTIKDFFLYDMPMALIFVVVFQIVDIRFLKNQKNMFLP